MLENGKLKLNIKFMYCKISEKNPSDIEPLMTGKCYCGHTEDLSEVSSKKMFMNAGLKKEWRCPQCGRSNVERDFKWTKIFK